MKLYIHSNSKLPCYSVLTEEFFTRYTAGNEHQYALDNSYLEVPSPTTVPDGAFAYKVSILNNQLVTECVPISEVQAINERDRLASAVRRAREAALVRSDWTQGKDIPENISNLWKEYRQALRDITDQPQFPYDVTWPKVPE